MSEGRPLIYRIPPIGYHAAGMGLGSSAPYAATRKEETKGLQKKQQHGDEILTFRSWLELAPALSSLGSELAQVIEQRGLIREIVSAAMSILRERLAEQVNIKSILRGVRFKFHFQGVQVLTKCSIGGFARECQREESYAHLIRPDSLDHQVKKGLEAVGFGERSRNVPVKPVALYVVLVTSLGGAISIDWP